jgi:hypothetical protein
MVSTLILSYLQHIFREVANALIRLAMAEPGENWMWERYNDLPDWELPISWTQGLIEC